LKSFFDIIEMVVRIFDCFVGLLLVIVGGSHTAFSFIATPPLPAVLDAHQKSLTGNRWFHKSSQQRERRGGRGPMQMASSSSSTKQEIVVVRQPDREFLQSKGVYDWGTWGCGVSKFPWTYDTSESCYLLAGQVTVTPTDDRPAATFGQGDFVTFPAGMSCTWDVKEAVEKHYMFF
jgi:uncharacterized protein